MEFIFGFALGGVAGVIIMGLFSMSANDDDQ